MAQAWNEEKNKNIQGVVNEKSKYQAAYDAGDEEGMAEARENAKAYYDNLTSSGHYDTVRELQAMGYDEAKGFYDNYAGLKPEESKRDIATDSFKMAQSADEKKQKHTDEFGDMVKEGYYDNQKVINSNPMNSDYAKSIMDVFYGKGEDARGDVLADGSVRNDGNLDTFTQANADRQEAAYKQMGVEHVNEHYKTQVAGNDTNYNSMMRGMQAVGDEWDEASANADSTAYMASQAENEERTVDTDNAVKEAGVTGRVPDEFEVNPEASKTEGARQFDEEVRLQEEGNALVKDEISANREIEEQNRAVDLLKLAASYELTDPNVAKQLKAIANNILAGTGQVPVTNEVTTGDNTAVADNDGVKAAITPGTIAPGGTIGKKSLGQGAKATSELTLGEDDAGNENTQNRAAQNVRPVVDDNKADNGDVDSSEVVNEAETESGTQNASVPANSQEVNDLIGFILSTTPENEVKDALKSQGITGDQLRAYYNR